ncbi:MAG TPA: hypothetical protein PKM73_18170 [Verrucomicrobiota bacterium]|nr:hypothetical protein [Verrucomicrobiota bacterium]HNU53120.1 hypothetical protein [Verrucomicrobiota bacterium]
MKEEFDEKFMAENRDPLDAPDQGFDWQLLYQRLNEDATSGENDQRMSQTVIRLLQMLLPMSSRRIQPESLGLRLIALAWVLSPGYFEGNPSVRRLARRCGVRIAALANYTGYYSRLLRWRNRGQRHAWNWLRHGTPVRRGAKARNKLKRNVPASGEGQKADTNRGKATGASRRESTPQQPDGGVAPVPTTKRTRTGKE